jgi:S1-C subfamily serine protease
VLVLAGLLMLAACASQDIQEKRLAPPKPTGEFRLDDIERAVSEEPIRAIHLIGMYEAHYRDSGDIAGRLDAFQTTAIENIKNAQMKAIAEKRFDDAASLARSLAVLGIAVENTGAEPELLLADAKKQLAAGNDLAAFLAAVHAHRRTPLSFDDALLFLERAVAVKQRRTAAFFLSVAEGQGSVQPELRQYAQGQDKPTDMIKGVATVLVDQGTHIERGRGVPAMTLGSAFFVDAAGFLITNYHVISSEVDPAYEGYSRMYIRMGDATSPRIPAKVIGYDKVMDLALIKAEMKPEYVFSVADFTVPAVGDAILAIGSPGGLEKTVTQGIVSALGRRFLQIGDVIQIDAAVNHGNSGGPVLDRDGRLVGVVFAGADAFQGLNFAIPAARLVAALPAMLKGGKAERPWLGLTINETADGAEIIYVAPFTPASDQQIPEGSLIASINNEKVGAVQGGLIPALQDILFANRAGELVSVETTDGDRYVMMSVVRPDVPLADAAKKDSRERLTAPLFGLILAPSLEKSKSSTYLVKKVVRGSIADDAGLSKDDPIVIRGFRVEEKVGYAFLDIDVKKRRMAYLETSMRLPAMLDSPDTL